MSDFSSVRQQREQWWRSILKSYFGESIYQDWFQQIKESSFENGKLVLCAPSFFVKDWVCSHYMEDAEKVLIQGLPDCCSVSLKFEVPDDERQDTQSVLRKKPAMKETSDLLGGNHQDIPTSFLDPRFTFDHFVVGKPNEFAYAAAKRIAESDEAIYNPLFLYGPVGHGKTHLMHSIAHAIKDRYGASKKVLYLSAERFMYYFIRALRFKNMMAFKERFRSVHVLMIDDVQFISGKDATQEEFFHTFNALVDAKRQVIVSADQSPSDLDGLQERMRSRLGWGLVADLHPTTYELRISILQSKAEQHRLALSNEVLEFLAENISSSVRELEGALVRLAAHHSLVGKKIDLECVQKILKDVLAPPARSVSIEDIERKVCDYFHVRVTDLHSVKRSRNISRPRQIAMFLSKHLTTESLPSIGRYFGGRDHTTVMHGIAAIERLIARDLSIKESVNLLRQSLESS